MLMESVLTYLIEGIDILGYLDDLVLWNPCKHGLNMQVQRSVSLLDGLRLTTNLIKSSPFPCLSLTWLGVVWDAALGTWCPTPKLLDKISAAAGDLLEARKGSKTVGRLCGFLALASQINRRANHLADPVTRLGLLARSRNRDEKVRVPSTLLEILVPWTRVKSWVTTDIFAPPTNLAHCWTEVSKAGWGVMDDQGKCWKGRWSQEESSQHIKVLELCTILLAVRLIDPRDQTLVVWSDNQTAISVIQRLGSRSPDLQKLAGLLLKEMEQRRVYLAPRHIGKTECGSGRTLARGGNPRRVGAVGPDVSESGHPARLGPAGGSICVSAQPETPGLFLSVPIPASPRYRRVGTRLEPIQSGSDLPSAQPHRRNGQKADRIQGGGEC